MRRDEAPIPLRSIVCLPRWLMVVCVATSVAAMLLGCALIVYGIGWAETGGRLGGAIGGGIGCVIGGAGGLFGTLRDWNRRLPASTFLSLVRNDVPHPFYRRVFWPAVAALAVGLLAGLLWNHRAIWHGVVQTSAILAFVSGASEAARRHSTRRARAVFALYADGLLDPEDAAAIDDARAKDPAFDTDLTRYVEVGEQVRAFASS